MKIERKSIFFNVKRILLKENLFEVLCFHFFSAKAGLIWQRVLTRYMVNAMFKISLVIKNSFIQRKMN